MKFNAILQLSGKTATGIPVPDEVIAGLGAGKKPPVRVTIRGYTYRTTIGSMGGQFMIPVSSEHRAGAGISAGDELEVEIEHDTEPRELDVPDDLREALEREPAAKQFFDGLSISNKKRFILPIEGAKTNETRMRNIEKTIAMLRQGQLK